MHATSYFMGIKNRPTAHSILSLYICLTVEEQTQWCIQ